MVGVHSVRREHQEPARDRNDREYGGHVQSADERRRRQLVLVEQGVQTTLAGIAASAVR